MSAKQRNTKGTKVSTAQPESQTAGTASTGATETQEQTNQQPENTQSGEGTTTDNAGATEGQGTGESTEGAASTEGEGADGGEASQGADETPTDTEAAATAASDAEAAAVQASAAEQLLVPKSELELLVERATAEGDSIMASVVQVCTEYRSEMQPNKMVEKETIRSQQLAFFRLVRDILRSPGYYKPALNVLLSYMREDYDGKGALSVPGMMRGFDDDTLASMPAENRQLFWALTRLLTAASGLNDYTQTYKQVSMAPFQAASGLTPEMKQRLVSFFSA